MRRFALQACLCWFLTCGTTGPFLSNTAPLTFGMNEQAAATALGVPLVPIRGVGRSKIYLATRRASVPGYPVRRRIYLQFRNGHLTGWKNDWRMPPPWF